MAAACPYGVLGANLIVCFASPGAQEVTAIRIIIKSQLLQKIQNTADTSDRVLRPLLSLGLPLLYPIRKEEASEDLALLERFFQQLTKTKL